MASFYMPAKYYIENNCVENHASELAALGSRAFIVTGKSSAKNGSLDDVKKALDQYQVKYEIFDETEQNPSVEQIMLMRDKALSFGADFFIGIGGGSPMDAAKAAALMAKNPYKDGSVLFENIKLEHFPVAAIPTTAGTGSEVTQYSILTRHDKGTKKSISHAVFPKLALDDPKYLSSLPHEKLIDTAVDTLAHLIESRLSANGENSEIFTEAGLKMWGELKFKILENTLTDLDRVRLIKACICGGIAIAQTSTSLPHGLSYMATYKLGIPHGRACGIYLGGYLDTYPDGEKAAVTANLLGFEDTRGFREFITFLLSEKPLESDFAAENAQSLLQNPAKLKNHPYEVTLGGLLRMENTYDKTV
ncbi:MAG: iron-containing alcohol dehydrogenase [Firmicutes bacterium]|nr:iron-containing alcohol dehydrogenase [Bacillota bacterium]